MRDDNVALSVFEFHVIGLGWKHDKVVRMIVSLVAILVMNYLANLQRPAEFLLRDDAVDGVSALLGIPRRVFGFVFAQASQRTIPAPTLGYLGRSQVKAFAAGLTNAIFASATAGRVAQLRTPNAPTEFATPTTVVLFSHATTVADSAEEINGWFSPHCLTPAS